MYKNIISVQDPKQELYTILVSEQATKERFSFKVEHQNSETFISITAKDISSLKAMNNSAMQLLELISKTKSFINEKKQ